MNYLKKKRLALMKSKTFYGYMKTVSGYPLTLSDCVENGLINLKISGNSVQDGTPSPENPIDVQSVGDYDEATQKYKIRIKINDENTVNIYLDEPLRKCGEYADYVDYKNKKVIRQIGKYYITNEQTFNKYGVTDKGLYRYGLYPEPSMVAGTRLLGFGNFLPNLRQSWLQWDNETLHLGQANSQIYIIVHNYYENDIDLYNYLSNNGTNDIYVIYILAEPIEEDINIEKIQVKKGTNIISAETVLEPSNIEAQYYSSEEE